MQSHIYFTCPTDHLESIITETFKEESYFISSLGNSIDIDHNLIDYLEELFKSNSSIEISFVLSDTNHIVFDTLKKKESIQVNRLNHFYKHIESVRRYSEEIWCIYNWKFLILSYHLNSKIRELRKVLGSFSTNSIQINGKVYSNDKKVFNTIYSDLICGYQININ